MSAKPRWVQALLKALSLPENKDKTIYQIATIDSNHIPHVRSHVHRALLFPKGHPTLPILLTTTDVRTPKVTQMLSNPVVEVCWWLEGSQDQFRIKGRICVIPAPDHPFHTMQNIPPGSALEKLSEKGEDEAEKEGKYNWEKKRKEVFNDMSRHMKAGWARPLPGAPMKSYDEAKTWPKTLPNLGEEENEEEKKNLEFAFGNFALVVIEPLEVDFVQLGIIPNQRTIFKRQEGLGTGEEWVEEIVVP